MADGSVRPAASIMDASSVSLHRATKRVDRLT
jgi:hypothetical protein